TQIGTNGLVRVDYIDREWQDFYGVFTSPNNTVDGPSGDLDLQTFGNTNDLERTYQAVQLQGAYRVTNRFNLGGNYTWSRNRGNTEGESTGSGPVADLINSYSEYKAFDRHQPVGYLLSDQEHKVRAWASYDLPMGAFGNLNITALQRFDSGSPYSAAANVQVGSFVGDIGYATPPAAATYFFSDRGEFRWEDTTSTDLALNWNLGLGRVNLFAQGEVLNVFDESAQVNGSSAVAVLAPFNPFTETPVEGVHWEKRASFGTATSVNHYQLPLTYRFSVGLKF
ncbi:MAG: hypothetical protein LC732_09390, partial [Acidobacteria bacterium]|nr:hypothetical protein [Acidobacteriota bacterium]